MELLSQHLEHALDRPRAVLKNSGAVPLAREELGDVPSRGP